MSRAPKGELLWWILPVVILALVIVGLFLWFGDDVAPHSYSIE